jgi:hypothetical protein
MLLRRNIFAVLAAVRIRYLEEFHVPTCPLAEEQYTHTYRVSSVVNAGIVYAETLSAPPSQTNFNTTLADTRLAYVPAPPLYSVVNAVVILAYAALAPLVAFVVPSPPVLAVLT